MRGVCLFVVSVYMLIGVCVVCVLLVVSMVSVMRVCLTTTPVAGSFPTWCPAPRRAKVADGALPASKTGPGLPPVPPQRPDVKQPCLSQIHTAADFLWKEKTTSEQRLKLQCGKSLLFLIFCYNLSSKTKSCKWCNDNVSLR